MYFFSLFKYLTCYILFLNSIYLVIFIGDLTLFIFYFCWANFFHVTYMISVCIFVCGISGLLKY